MVESHLRAFASFVGTTVSVREGPCSENEEQCAHDLRERIRAQVGILLTAEDALSLLRLNASALDPAVKEALAECQDEIFDCVMAARRNRTLNSRRE